MVHILIPTVADYTGDINKSVSFGPELKEAGYDSGLMLVTRGGRTGVTLDTGVTLQYQNLDHGARNYTNSPIVVMLSNIPIEEMDFHANPDYAAEHVMRGIDFARGLPIGGSRYVTFHLNSLVTKDMFTERNGVEWRNIFNNRIRHYLERIARYSKNRGIYTLVETVPVPEFGDVPLSEDFTYNEEHISTFRNPFYLTSSWGFEEIYNTGLGICLDVCHTRTIYEAIRRGITTGILFEEDLDDLSDGSLIHDVSDLSESDLIHLNDGLGVYSEGESVFVEGVALGQGDVDVLPEVVNRAKDENITMVLEINEKRKDFDTRPNTQTSIDYLKEMSD